MRVPALLAHVIIAGTTILTPPNAMAWHDATHMAIVKAAGLDDFAYLAVGADMAKEKAGARENGNHYYNKPRVVTVTPRMVMDQVRNYNKPGDADGHLYGAIIAAINDYIRRGAEGKYDRYPFGYAAHYIGDLSMPFHNMVYDAFNKANHSANDGIVENTGPVDESMDRKVDRISAEIRKRMNKLPAIQFSTDIRKFYRELAVQIAAIANRASVLGYALEDSNPPRTRLTEEEAYTQLAQSALLLKALAAAVMK